MAYLKNWTDNFFQIFFIGTSWLAVSINNMKTCASREMTSRKNIKIFYFNGVNAAKHWHVAGEVYDTIYLFQTAVIYIKHMYMYLPSLIALRRVVRNPSHMENHTKCIFSSTLYFNAR